MTDMDCHTRPFIGVEVVVAENLGAGTCVANGSRIRRSRVQAATNWNSVSEDVTFVQLHLLPPS
jgi:hypothetical protein